MNSDHSITDDYHVNVDQALNALAAGRTAAEDLAHLHYAEAQVRATLALAAAVHRLSS